MAKPKPKTKAPAKKKSAKQAQKKDGQKKSQSLEEQSHPEIFIGLVSPLGVDLDIVCDELSQALTEVGYEPEIIRLTDIFEVDKIAKIHQEKLDTSSVENRYTSYIKAGNALRKNTECMEILSLLAIDQIRERRMKRHLEKAENKRTRGKKRKELLNKAIPKKAYILRSFKNAEEIKTLQNVYGTSFFVISVYSPKDRRKENLAKRIAASHGDASNYDRALDKAEKLIEQDYNEADEDYGQDVSGAFPLADLFIEVEETRTKLIHGIKRFIHTLFDYPYHTPTKNEYGMFLAFSAALRSADLSRQVGAALLNSEGDLLAIGCNEVPKFGGGQYWEDDEGDKARDFELGYDSSAKMKKEMLEETIHTMKMKDVGLIKDKRKPAEITKEILTGKLKKYFKQKDITNLLEFGRMIHAEMAAISDAAKRGISLQGATLYCTTFPCHMCARHIVASGIQKVVYVEPYPKSKAHELYQDSIIVDPPHEVLKKVGFVPFVGISPYRFNDFFGHGKIKNSDGTKLKWSTRTAKPKIKIYNDMSYISLEIVSQKAMASILK